MTGQTEPPVLRILRRLQAGRSAMRDDIGEIRTRLTRMDENLAGIHRAK